MERPGQSADKERIPASASVRVALINMGVAVVRNSVHVARIGNPVAMARNLCRGKRGRCRGDRVAGVRRAERVRTATADGLIETHHRISELRIGIDGPAGRCRRLLHNETSANGRSERVEWREPIMQLLDEGKSSLDVLVRLRADGLAALRRIAARRLGQVVE
ncbi:hypothetical protein PT2222_330055 [Paraburkholderia tropica]